MSQQKYKSTVVGQSDIMNGIAPRAPTNVPPQGNLWGYRGFEVNTTVQDNIREKENWKYMTDYHSGRERGTTNFGRYVRRIPAIATPTNYFGVANVPYKAIEDRSGQNTRNINSSRCKIPADKLIEGQKNPTRFWLPT